MPELYQSLSHSKWDCKYHVVFVPKAATESDLRADTASIGADFPRVGAAEGMRDSRRASDAWIPAAARYAGRILRRVAGVLLDPLRDGGGPGAAASLLD